MSQTRASDVLNWIVHAEDVPADHLDVGHHRLQVLAGAHGVAEAALERDLRKPSFSLMDRQRDIRGTGARRNRQFGKPQLT